MHPHDACRGVRLHARHPNLRESWLAEALRARCAESTSLHVAAALFSGLIATAACNPADVLKSRVMTSTSGQGGGSPSTLGIAWQIATREGPMGFYRGFLPAYARIGPTILIRTVARLQTRRAAVPWSPCASAVSPLRLLSRSALTL